METIDRDLVRGFLTGKLTRREFIVRAAAAGVSITGIASWLAACAPTPTPAPTAAPQKPATTSAPAAAKVSVAAGTKLTLKLRSSFITEGNEVLSALIKDWGKQNNIPVEADLVSMNDLQTIAATAAETGAGPDVVEMNQNSPHLFTEKLVDVSDVAEDLDKRYNGWYTIGKEACNVGGKWVAIPRFFAAHAIVYREDLFEKAGAKGPAQTWDEMLQIGKKLKELKLAPIGFPLGHAVGDGNNFCYSMLWSFGGKEVEADGKTVAIDSKETADAIDFMRNLFNEAMPKDVLSWDDASNNRTFLAGEVSATNNAASIWVTAKTSAPDIYKVTNHGLYPAGPKGRVVYGEMMSQGIFKYSKNIDAAKALVKHLHEKDQLAPWAQANYSFTFPLLKSYEEVAIMPWNTTPKLASFKTVASFAHLPGYPSTNGRAGAEAFAKWIVVDMFAKACSGTSTKDAIAWAATQLKGIYK